MQPIATQKLPPCPYRRPAPPVGVRPLRPESPAPTMVLAYDMPLYRPPSEGNNLIIQATIGCGHNACAFCSMYRDKDYRVRPLAEVAHDIQAAARVWPEAHRVFLADGDAFRLPTDHLLALLEALRGALPALARVSCYATPGDILRKEEDELAALRAAGLSLVYVGLESGDPDTTRRVIKGATPDAAARAVLRSQAAGIKVSATVILGLAGTARWREHAEATAHLITKAPPAYLSTLRLTLEPERRADYLARFDGDFHEQSDAGILDELAVMLTEAAPARPVIFRSNHASNALALAGTLPRDRDRLLAEVTAAKQGLIALRPAWLRRL